MRKLMTLLATMVVAASLALPAYASPAGQGESTATAQKKGKKKHEGKKHHSPFHKGGKKGK